MDCPKCGVGISKELNYCTSCGAPAHLKHSGFGIASFIVLLLWPLSFVTVIIFDDQITKLGLTDAFFAFFALGPVIATVLGFISLFAKNRNRMLGIIGLVAGLPYGLLYFFVAINIG